MLQTARNPVFVRTTTGEKELEAQKKVLEAVKLLDKNTIKELESINANVKRLAAALEKCCPPGGRGRRTTTNEASSLEGAITKALKKGNKGGGGGGGGAASATSSLASALSGSDASGRRFTGFLNKANIGIAGLTAGFTALSGVVDKFTQGLGIDVGRAFQGVISDEMNFITNMRKISSEVIQSGEDYNELSRKMIDIGDVVLETGVSRVKYQQLYQESMRKGLTYEVKAGQLQKRTLDDQKQLMKNSLATASLLGADADQTAQMFEQWNRQLGMSNNQLFQVGNSMRHIAQITGVSGNNLLEAAQEAGNYIKTLQRTGLLDSISAKNVIQSVTLFKKYGVEEMGGNILNALSSYENLINSDPNLQSLLSQVASRKGMMSQLYAGNVLSTEGGKRAMMGGIVEQAQSRLGQQFGISDVTKLPMILQSLSREGTRESDLKVRNINTFLKSMGLDPGTLAQFGKAMKEDIPLAEQIGNVEKELTAGPLEAGQRKGLEGRLKGLRQQEMTEKYSLFQENMARTGNVAESMASTNAYLQKQGLQGIGPGGLQSLSQGMLNALKEQATEAEVDFDSILGKQGLSEAGLVKGMADEKTMEKSYGDFQALQNEVLNAIQAEQNPMLKTYRLLDSWNETMKKFGQSWLLELTAPMLTGAIMAGLGLKAGAMGLQGLGALRGLFGFGGGAGGAVGVGGAGGAAGGGSLLSRALGLGGRGLRFGGRMLGGGLRLGGRVLSKAFLPLAALAGGGMRQFDTEGMAKAYGTSWENMTIAQRGGARGANFMTGAVSGMSTDIVDTVKDFGVLLAEMAGFKVPEGLKNFSLTETLGLGPDGAITKAIAVDTGRIAWVGEKIGESIGNLYSYINNYVLGDAAKLDAELAKKQKEHQAMGYDKAFNDPTNVNAKHWEKELARDKTVESLYKDMSGMTGQFGPMSAKLYSEKAQGILEQVLKSSENVQGAAGSDWTRVLTEIDRSKLSGEAASMFDMLSNRNKIAEVRSSIANDLMGEGMTPGAQFESERDKRLAERLETMGLNPDGSKAASEAFKKMNEPGSIYTHDIHVEELLTRIFGNASASTAQLGAFAPDQGSEAGSSAMDKSEVSVSEALTYTDSLAELMNIFAENGVLSPAKAIANTNLFSADDAEDYVARQVETARPSGPLSMLPSLDRISDYLIGTQSEKLDRIIQELHEINGNIKPTYVGGGEKDMKNQKRASTIKVLGKDHITGNWTGIQYPAYALQSNTTGDVNNGGV